MDTRTGDTDQIAEKAAEIIWSWKLCEKFQIVEVIKAAIEKAINQASYRAAQASEDAKNEP